MQSKNQRSAAPSGGSSVAKFSTLILEIVDVTFPLKLALRNSLTLRGNVYTEVTRNADSLARAHTFITRGVAEGVFKPRIDKLFTLDEVVEAHRYLESGQQFGKIAMCT